MPPSSISTLFPYTTLFRSWQTAKPAYRISLADGTDLVASPDHRFLTERGWKHVAPAASGQRPYLTVNNRLDRKSTRLNSSHLGISYAVFCLKKKMLQMAA